MKDTEIYLLMNKPSGYVCSAVSDSHKTVYQLLSDELQNLVQNAKRGHRLHTIGRLDCDTSGLLLLTTDGQFSHLVSSAPEIGGAGLTKTYRAELSLPSTFPTRQDMILRAAEGLTLPPEKKFPEQKSSPAELIFIDENHCDITVREGKFHEVKRIFRALGNEVKTLRRLSIGGLELPEDLKEGEYKSLSAEEFQAIFQKKS